MDNNRPHIFAVLTKEQFERAFPEKKYEELPESNVYFGPGDPRNTGCNKLQ